MPRIDPWWFHWLGSYCGSHIGAVASHPDGTFEPLAAIYPRIALAVVTDNLKGTDRSLQTLVRLLLERQLMRGTPLPEGERWRAANWNFPDDRTA